MSLISTAYGNLDDLAGALAKEILDHPSPNPLEQTLIVTSGLLQGRWLSYKLAELHGISMIKNVVPDRLVDICKDIFFSPDTKMEIASQTLVAGHILKLLPELLDHAEFANIKNYLADEDKSGSKKWEFASTMANLFDQYAIFRKDWTTSWNESGIQGAEEQPWQSTLWRRCFTSEGKLLTKEDFVTALEAVESPYNTALLPSRIYLFAVDWMTPVHERLVRHLSKFTQVFIFHHYPWLNQKGEAHPLLAPVNDRLPVTGDLLNNLEEKFPAKKELSGKICIHSSHGKMREMEVLHDRLLEAVAETGARPDEVMVLVPDLEEYEPHITAVFGQEGKLNCRLFGRRGEKGNAITETVDFLLSLPEKRFTAPEVMDFLSLQPIMSRFGLQMEDLEKIRLWISENNIAWGLDSEHRKKYFGAPSFKENSWEWGLARLFFSYVFHPASAMDDESRMYEGYLPSSTVNDENIRILGVLAELIHLFKKGLSWMDGVHTAQEWRKDVEELFRGFLEEDDPGVMSLIDACKVTFDELTKSGAKIPLAALKDLLQSELAERERNQQALLGGVTFSDYVTGHGIPAKVLALCGLATGVFPRVEKKMELDLMVSDPRPGDRSIRVEDRFIFTGLVLSKAKRIVMTYPGQSITNNVEIPVSVLVSELMEYLKSEDLEITRHRLHPFSPDYFMKKSDLKSYDSSAFRVAQKLVNAGNFSPQQFWDMSAELEYEFPKNYPLRTLKRFFENPARYFLANRLGWDAEETMPELIEEDPLWKQSYAEYNIKRGVVEYVLVEKDPKKSRDLFRAKGVLPFGKTGDLMFKQCLDEALPFAKVVKEQMKMMGEAEQDIVFEQESGDILWTGNIAGVYKNGLLRYKIATEKTKDFFDYWIDHFAANMRKPDVRSVMIFRNKDESVKELLSDDKAAEHFNMLVKIFRQGCRRPLPFFHRSSMAAAQILAEDPENFGKAQQVAIDTWNGDYEADHDSIGKFFGSFEKIFENEKLKEEFFILATEVYMPFYPGRREDVK